jgi:hypothetical protein
VWVGAEWAADDGGGTAYISAEPDKRNKSIIEILDATCKK